MSAAPEAATGTYLDVIEARSHLGATARAHGLKWRPEYSRALSACEEAVLSADMSIETETARFMTIARECCPRWSDECDQAFARLMEAVGANEDDLEPAEAGEA